MNPTPSRRGPGRHDGHRGTPRGRLHPCHRHRRRAGAAAARHHGRRARGPDRAGRPVRAGADPAGRPRRRPARRVRDPGPRRRARAQLVPDHRAGVVRRERRHHGPRDVRPRRSARLARPGQHRAPLHRLRRDVAGRARAAAADRRDQARPRRLQRLVQPAAPDRPAVDAQLRPRQGGRAVRPLRAQRHPPGPDDGHAPGAQPCPHARPVRPAPPLPAPADPGGPRPGSARLVPRRPHARARRRVGGQVRAPAPADRRHARGGRVDGGRSARRDGRAGPVDPASV